MNSLILLLRVSRPLGWIVAPLAFAIGFYYSNAGFGLIAILQLILLSFPFSVILYGMNDVYDHETDKLNPRKSVQLIAEKEKVLIKRASAGVAIILIASSVVTLNISNIVSMFFLVSVCYFYSAPPIRFKELPPLDSISNGALFYLAFALGYSYGREIFEIPLKIYFVAICVMGIHSFGAVMDYSADKVASVRTIAVVLGKRAASIFSCLAFLSALLFADIGRPYINYYFAFCSIIFLIAAVFPSERLASVLFKLIFCRFYYHGPVICSSLTYQIELYVMKEDKFLLP